MPNPFDRDAWEQEREERTRVIGVEEIVEWSSPTLTCATVGAKLAGAPRMDVWQLPGGRNWLRRPADIGMDDGYEGDHLP